ncbi:folate-sensitive fragile site protein Fra10Ac1-domain-containing protein [Leucosporidium creatinivorum]|uniref:Folate-sensitive fragile site protein Fra10Ac1-domain-containing protein n=1 Tax=Leucosporidium creatinivorum TaxID=106004 RepID=A0A1Y2G4N5_9BASI|nr:folate-sensitive fragile site protein Fra10Ac1-domain-containing protein [Leucosporidium creatinivorum]
MTSRPERVTTRPLNAHERLQARFAFVEESYRRGRQPPRPKTKTELDVLKERHQFIRSEQQDPSTLSWEDRLAVKYYDSLFREYALVNLKHYRSGAVALRWRTETELLAGIGHLTCGSLRCSYHQPSPTLVAAFEEDEAAGLVDPDSTEPLVRCRLFEQEMQFGYVEEGMRKSAVVKVVLCEECRRKLRRGREMAKELREGKERAAAGGGGEQRRVEAPPSPPPPRRSREESSDNEYGPARPPELDEPRRDGRDSHSRSDSRSRRRSASPPRRR